MSLAYRKHVEKEGENKKSPKEFVEIDWEKEEGGAKQSFKEECDINNIVSKAKKMGISLEDFNRTANYVNDLPDLDYQTAMNKLIEGKEVFEQLPADVRKACNNNVSVFLDKVHSEGGMDWLIEMGLQKKVLPPDPMEVKVVNQVVPDKETEK